MRRRVFADHDLLVVNGRVRVKRVGGSTEGRTRKDAPRSATRLKVDDPGPQTPLRSVLETVNDQGGPAIRNQARTTHPSSLSFTLSGQMQSGKNRVLITRTGHRYPPARFAKWRDEKVREVMGQLKCTMASYYAFRKPQAVVLTVRYWPGDRIKRDAPGMLDALCHVLERAYVLEDDAQIKEVAWKEMDLDRERPRVELTMTALEG